MRGRLPYPVGAFDFVPPQVVEAAKRLFSHLKLNGVVGPFCARTSPGCQPPERDSGTDPDRALTQGPLE